MIRLRTLGECAIDVNGTTIRPGATMVFAVLLYLCAERGRLVERDHLAALLWPRASAARRKHNLRQILYKLSQLGVRAGGPTGPLCLPSNEVWLDFEDAAPDEGEQAQPADWTPGDGRSLLGYSPRGSAAFRAWLDELRARVESAMRRRAVAALKRARASADWSAIERAARLTLTLDPLNEEATLSLAEATALAGSKARAIAMLNRYIAELGPGASEARIPAEVLRRRIVERMPARPAGLVHVPMIGRDDVMAELGALIDRVRAGEAAWHLMSGPHGIGKTRVLEELAQQAALKGVHTVLQRALPDDADTPGLTLTRLYRALLGQPGSLGIAPDVLAFLQRLTAQDTTPLNAPRFDSGEDALVRALVDLERAIAWNAPLVLALDDAHLADALSLRILKRAHGCLTDERVLLVVAAIDDVELRGAATSHRVLERLDAQATLHLSQLWIDARGGGAEDGTVESLAVASGGNPFLLREAAIASGDARRSVKQIGSIESVLQLRCAELSDNGREMLLTSLILGEHASVSMLLTAATHEGSAETALVELERARVLSCQSSGSIHIHSLWQNALPHLYPAGQIAARRIRVAQLLEAAAEGRSDAAELLLTSAMQFQRAGDPGRASTTLARGGAALKMRALGPAAAAAFSRAATLSPSAPEVDQRLLQAILAAADAGQYDDVKRLLDHFGDRLAISNELGGDSVRLRLIMIRFRQLTGDPDPELIRTCEELITAAELTPLDKLRAGLMGIRMAEFAGDPGSVARLYTQCASIVSESPHARLIFEQMRVVNALTTRRVSLACSLAEDLLSTLGDAVQPFDYLNIRVPHWFNCNFARIDALIGLAQAQLEGYRATLTAVRVADVAASHAVDTMRLSLAREQVDLALELASRFDHVTQRPMILQTLGRLEVAEGKHASHDSEPRTIPGGQPMYTRDKLFALCNIAVCACRRGDRPILEVSAHALTEQCARLERMCPMDYPFAALAIAKVGLAGDGAGASTWARYRRTVRVAAFPPSPFTTSLLSEFFIED